MNTNKMCPQTTCYIYKIDSSYICDKLSGHYFLVLARIEHKEIIRTQTKFVPGRPVAYIRETSTTPPPNIYWHNGQFLNIQFFMWCWSISISIVKVILEIFWQCILFSLLFRPWRLIQLIIIRQMSQYKQNKK